MLDQCIISSSSEQNVSCGCFSSATESPSSPSVLHSLSTSSPTSSRSPESVLTDYFESGTKLTSPPSSRLLRLTFNSLNYLIAGILILA